MDTNAINQTINQFMGQLSALVMRPIHMVIIHLAVGLVLAGLVWWPLKMWLCATGMPRRKAGGIVKVVVSLIFALVMLHFFYSYMAEVTPPPPH